MTAAPPSPRRKSRHFTKVFLGVLAVYLAVVYIVMPQLDRLKVRRHPDLGTGAHITHTGTGLPGDPINISLVGTEDEVDRAFKAAGWDAAKPLDFDSSLRIAVDTVIDRPDPEAPVSSLYLFGRKEDLAFEKPVGHSPRERHHVRFWRSPTLQNRRPLWLGSATHDIRVELSRATGQVTHRIAADVDAERDFLVANLTATKLVVKTTWITGFQMPTKGKNGGMDPWFTDGRLPVLTLVQAAP